MIRYLVTCVNDGVTSILHDSSNDAYQLQSCTLDREYRNGVEDKVLKFTILPVHPNADVVQPMTTTLYVVEDGVELFRGRAINIDVDKYGTKKITCESDIKFLVDVPDVFSMRTDGETKIYIGLEENGEITGRYLQMHDLGWRYTDPQTAETKTVYEYIRPTNYYYIPVVWSDYNFRPDDAGKLFTVRIDNAATDAATAAILRDKLDQLAQLVSESGTIIDAEDVEDVNELLHDLENYFGIGTTVSETGVIEDYAAKYARARNYLDDDIIYGITEYEIPLVKVDMARESNYHPGKFVNVSLLYFGNINLVYNNSSMASDSTTRPAGDIYTRLYRRSGGNTFYGPYTAPATITIPEPEDTNNVDFSTLDFCIVHLHDPIKDELTGGNGYVPCRDITWVFTTQTPPTETGVKGRIKFLVKRDNNTYVESMVSNVFSTVNDGIPDNGYGYNLYAGDYRHIYRGDISGMVTNAPIDNANVVSVYSQVEKWAKETNSYARIRKDDGFYYFDLISRTGAESSDFYVELGTNVIDYAKVISVKDLATAIFPVGVKKSNDSVIKTYQLDGDSGIVPVSNYDVDEEKKIVYNTLSTPAFGLIVLYREYDVSNLNTESETMWRQYLYSRAVAELEMLQKESVSIEISVIDSRLLHTTGAAPVLGYQYPVDIPLFGGVAYYPVTKIFTDLIQPSRSKMTFGQNRTLLSDYVSRKG